MRMRAVVLLFLCRTPMSLFLLAQGCDVPRTKTGFLTADEAVRIHYLEEGKGPGILFVPGWTMPADIWEHQIRHFSRTHRVVAMDPRSQGLSSQTAEGLHPAARARDIKAVVDQLKLAPVVLVGWSMGVAELAAYVEQFGTTDLSGLVLVDGIAGWDYDPVITPTLLKFASSFQKDRQAATESFVRGMYRRQQSEAYLKRIIQASLRTPTHSAVALFLGAITSDHRPALQKIDKPTLMAVAAGGPFDAAYEDMRKSIKGARLERFEGAGHALFVDEPDRFNALLGEFLKSVHSAAQSY